MKKPEVVFIGLGSNLNNPPAQLDAAVAALRLMPDINLIAVSSYYQTPPMGYLDQPEFTNAVIQIETLLEPLDLLDRLKNLEIQQGRVKTIKNGPRTLDCDILFFGERVLVSERLTLPHPGAFERDFVLKPLQEIAPWMLYSLK